MDLPAHEIRAGDLQNLSFVGVGVILEVERIQIVSVLVEFGHIFTPKPQKIKSVQLQRICDELPLFAFEKAKV